MYIIVKWITAIPYKYQYKTIWDKKTKSPRPKFIKYIGKATDTDIKRYYKGGKWQ